MNKLGFSVLTMGFTGSEALRWKIEYAKAFEAMEEQLRQPMGLPQTYRDALVALVESLDNNALLSAEVKTLTPKAAFYDTVADSKTAIAIGDVAKIIGVKGMGRNNLFAFLRGRKILDANNVPYQKYQDRGYFNVIEQSVTMGNDVHVKFKTLVFQKGIDYISKLLKEAV